MVQWWFWMAFSIAISTQSFVKWRRGWDRWSFQPGWSGVLKKSPNVGGDDCECWHQDWLQPCIWEHLLRGWEVSNCPKLIPHRKNEDHELLRLEMKSDMLFGYPVMHQYHGKCKAFTTRRTGCGSVTSIACLAYASSLLPQAYGWPLSIRASEYHYDEMLSYCHIASSLLHTVFWHLPFCSWLRVQGGLGFLCLKHI